MKIAVFAQISKIEDYPPVFSTEQVKKRDDSEGHPTIKEADTIKPEKSLYIVRYPRVTGGRNLTGFH